MIWRKMFDPLILDFHLAKIKNLMQHHRLRRLDFYSINTSLANRFFNKKKKFKRKSSNKQNIYQNLTDV